AAYEIGALSLASLERQEAASQRKAPFAAGGPAYAHGHQAVVRPGPDADPERLLNEVQLTLGRDWTDLAVSMTASLPCEHAVPTMSRRNAAKSSSLTANIIDVVGAVPSFLKVRYPVDQLEL